MRDCRGARARSRRRATTAPGHLRYLVRALWLAASAVALLALAACAPAPPVVRVLLIGNSFTERNGGIGPQLERLAPAVRAESVVVGGYTLENHWTNGTALKRIRSGGWAFVVLQDQSMAPVASTAEFYTYGQSFGSEIVLSGARPVLLMTWERPDAVAAGVTTERLASAYDGLGSLIGAKVAPAGRAFAASLKERPDLVLNVQDGHPTPYGTYLAACVLYGTLFDKTPVGNVAADPLLPPEIQAYFQRIAASALGY
jgi:hypothetical protein